MDIIFPRVVQAERFDETRIREQIDQLYYQWWQYCPDRQPVTNVNIRFDHDPNWKNRFLSIQSAKDGNHPIWKATKVFCTFAFGIV